MTLAEKYHKESVEFMKKKGKKLSDETRQAILQEIEYSLTDGDFYTFVEAPINESEFVKAFLIGEGFSVKEKGCQYSCKTVVFKVEY